MYCQSGVVAREQWDCAEVEQGRASAASHIAAHNGTANPFNLPQRPNRVFFRGVSPVLFVSLRVSLIDSFLRFRIKPSNPLVFPLA